MHNQFSPQCLPIKCIPLIRWRYVLFILSYKSFSSLLCFSSDLQKMFDKTFSEVSEMDDWTMPNFCLAEWWSSVIGAVICMVMRGNLYVSFLPILLWLDYCFSKIAFWAQQWRFVKHSLHVFFFTSPPCQNLTEQSLDTSPSHSITRQMNFQLNFQINSNKRISSAINNLYGQ